MRRRDFVAAAVPVLTKGAGKLHVASNIYPWRMFAEREGRKMDEFGEETLKRYAAAGLRGFEPIVGKAANLDGLGARLKAWGLEMRSIYVNSTLHVAGQAAKSLGEVLDIARAAVKVGTRIVVTNPSPIRWGGSEEKSDSELQEQAKNLEALGVELKKLGMQLAYHNHDSELRAGAREFHHMLTGTDEAAVKFCLDAHWVYRGCGNSGVALFDALEHYGKRVVELHVRQSKGGVWSESFTGDGDVDYGRIAAWLVRRGMKPLVVLEQAVEKGSAKTMDAVAAHRAGVAEAERVFGSLA